MTVHLWAGRTIRLLLLVVSWLAATMASATTSSGNNWGSAVDPGGTCDQPALGTQ